MANATVKVLIIEDEQSIRESMRLYLESLGYEVITAEDPTLCPVYHHDKCTMHERCADVLIIDQNMPNMTGAEFIEMQLERGCKLPAKYKLIMTGALTDEIVSLAERLGCRVVQKPFTLMDLESFVAIARADKESGELP